MRAQAHKKKAGRSSTRTQNDNYRTMMRGYRRAIGIEIPRLRLYLVSELFVFDLKEKTMNKTR